LTNQYDIKIFGLNKERKELYNDIDERVENMFRQGLLEEVKALLNSKLGLTSREAIGLKELKGYLDGECSLEEAKELIKKNTRNYARRQLTWFCRDKRIVWIDVSISGRDTLREIEKRM
jgi:tRNA dimethylallyltransferase